MVVGSAVAAAVVLIAATLLLVIIALARRITGQAHSIAESLEGTRRNTAPLREVAMVTPSVESITRGLRSLRGVEGPVDERTVWQRAKGAVARQVR